MPRKRTDTGVWEAPKEIDPDKHVGFVYLIIERDTGRRYIGKKLFRQRRGKNKGKAHDWRGYRSSSKFLRKLIQTRGDDKFRFIILGCFETQATLSYAESFALLRVRSPERNDIWLNRRIDAVRWRCREPLTEEFIRRLDYYSKKG